MRRIVGLKDTQFCTVTTVEQQYDMLVLFLGNNLSIFWENTRQYVTLLRQMLLKIICFGQQNGRTVKRSCFYLIAGFKVPYFCINN